MGYRKVNDDSLALVANAIREKGGTSETLIFPDDFKSAIMAIKSGVELNFDVVAYATEAALLADTPKENTIGIITDTDITGWAFSPVEPMTPSVGLVWITIGTSSEIEFNALTENTIQVYPISVKQYVNGTWMNAIAMSYQDGLWTTWIKFLLGNGSNNLGIPTWKTVSGTASGDTLVTSASENDDGTVSLSVKTASGKWTNLLGIFPMEVKKTHNKLSISLTCTGKSSSESGDTFAVRLYSDYEATNRIAISEAFTCATVQLNQMYSVDFDITSLEKFYIAVYVAMGNTSINPMDVTINEIKME